MDQVQIPEIYQSDINKAIEILKTAGCTDIYLFGSLATGKSGESSDIDLAVRGCPLKPSFLSTLIFVCSGLG
jgi:predicted nucleotidyltransferase